MWQIVRLIATSSLSQCGVRQRLQADSCGPFPIVLHEILAAAILLLLLLLLYYFSNSL